MGEACSIDSSLWRVRCYNGAVLNITQVASGVTRQASRSALPDTATLATVSENRFNALVREAFHGKERR